MPFYSSVCRQCGQEHSYLRKIDQRADTPICCDQATEKTLDAPMISAMCFQGHKGFMTSGNGKWLESGQDVKRYMKEKNLLSHEEGTREAEIQSKAKEVKQRKALRAAAIAAVDKHIG